ncbi:LysR family transcriptional regulator [Zavarzinia sp. CC-PAN008]|uniref:LysR family transcriptional regulator n=1 Tax=Zavarzinia sp. CC-PAN008 TaxID=3243332 RepID=UPI003F7475AA
MNTPNLQDAATFLKVIEVGGFAAAARELGVTQSTVSRRVSELERRLGRRLIERTTRRLILTEAGERYGDAVRDLLAGLADAEAGLDDDVAGAHGPLRITIPSSYGRHCVLPVLAGFAARYPRVRLDIDLSDRYADLLSEGYDFAVRLTEPRASGLQAQLVRRMRAHVCATPGFLDAHPVRGADDLVDERCLVQRTYAPRTVWPLRVRDVLKEVHIRPRMLLNDVEAVRAMALAGMGIATLPGFLVDGDLAQGRLRLAHPDLTLGAVRIYLVWPRHKAGLPRIRALRDHLEAHLPTEGR